MEEPEFLRVVLPGGQDQVVARQTQGPLHGGVERPVQHHIVHPWGLNQLRELHGPRVATAWEMTTPAGERRLTHPGLGDPNGRAREVEPRPGWAGAARPVGYAPPWPRSLASLLHHWPGIGRRGGLAADPVKAAATDL